MRVDRLGRHHRKRAVVHSAPSHLWPNSCESVNAIALDLGIINEASGFEQAGILGGNFLRNYRLTFDFKNSKVIFVPIVQEK